MSQQPKTKHPIFLHSQKMAPPLDCNKEMSLVLSNETKPRLKWTQELHQRFVEAVDQLGGPEKATPKCLMRVMGIGGLTLYHLKSHLQKYRLGKSQQPQMFQQPNQKDNAENKTTQLTGMIPVGAQEELYDFRGLQVAQALQMQMDVQKKLHEQIQVQKHLQLRIEAQGKYLQSVLKKAHDTLSEHTSCSIEVEKVKAKLSELVSMVDSGCPNSTFSALNRGNGLSLGHSYGYSVESSLTSSDSTERREQIQTNNDDPEKNYKRKEKCETESIEKTSGKKRREKGDESKGFDLNRESMNEFGSGVKGIDLNSNGVEMFDAHF